MGFVKNIIIILSLAVIAESCTTVQTKVDVTKKYKMDILIKNKEFEAVGAITLPKKPLYTIDFESDGRLSLFTFRTCSREIAIENASRGLNPHKVSINYRPNEIESSGACPADIGAFDESGRHAWGYIDFEDDSTTLTATNICGKNTEETQGVSVCQERMGLIQKIKFNVPVIVSPDEGCELDSGNEGTEFTYTIKKGYCVYAFMEKAAPNKVHRHTTYGFEEIIIRR